MSEPTTQPDAIAELRTKLADLDEERAQSEEKGLHFGGRHGLANWMLRVVPTLLTELEQLRAQAEANRLLADIGRAQLACWEADITNATVSQTVSAKINLSHAISAFRDFSAREAKATKGEA